jgi:hypothetical protein
MAWLANIDDPEIRHALTQELCKPRRAYACSTPYGVTFYLLADVQGITSVEQARTIATHLTAAEYDEVSVTETLL